MTSNLPEQLRKQVEATNAMLEQLNKPAESTDASAETTDKVEQTEGNAAPLGAASEEVSQQHAAAPESEKTVTQSDDENSPTYAQRWRSLQGTFNVTKTQLNEAAQRIANLEHLVATMQTAPAPAASATAEKQLLTATDTTEYGADMVDFVRRAAREETAPLAQALLSLQRQIDGLQGMAPVVKQVVAKQNQTAEEQFFTRLTARVSDWQVVNDNPAFHTWLMTPDDMTGITRQTFLVDAQRAMDVDRVVNIFNNWKRENGVKQVQAPAQNAKTASQLERQVAPGRASASSAAPTQQKVKTYTPMDIAKFYEDKRRGLYKDRRAEADALEADIFLAQREGRIARNAA